MKFWMNPDIDLTKISDSMLLDSGQAIASLEKNGIEAKIIVHGEVRVWWNPYVGTLEAEVGETPFDGELFERPSEFPEELKNLISSDKYWDTDERVHISENNWFEVFVCEKGGYTPDGGVVDVEGLTPKEIKTMLEDFIDDYIKEHQWNKMIGDGTLVWVPDEINATHPNFFDDLEYRCWNLFKQYLEAFGIKLVSDDIDFFISKQIQEQILKLLERDNIQIDL